MLETRATRDPRSLPRAVAVFARPPVRGQAKTRLIPLLGEHGAADFQAALAADAVRKLRTLCGGGSPVSPYLFIADLFGSSEGPRTSNGRALRSSFKTILQKGGDLGERLTHAFRYLWVNHRSAVVIGTDSPLLPVRLLRVALSELEVSDAVLGPCPDGGYYLIGLRRPSRERPLLAARVFGRVRWGSRFAFKDTLRNMLGEGLSCSMLDSVRDIDRPADVHRLRRELATNAGARRLAPDTARFLLNLPTP